MADENFNLFTARKQLDPTEVDKAIRGLYKLMSGVQRRQAWPVGSIFITVTNENPADLLGYGTWVPYGGGRVLIGVDDNNFNPSEITG
jgi:hypothetical protein